MTKKELKDIINKYKSADRDISELDDKYGVCLWDSKNENFYNKYNWVIFRLLEHLFGEYGKELIEDHIFNNEFKFDTLCEMLNIHE